MNLFDLVAKIMLDTSEYEKGLDDSEKKADGFGSKLGSAVKKGSALAVAGITAVATGATIMGKKLYDSANATADYGDQVDKMSQKIGISAESYQKWDYVMQRAGTSVDNLKMGMKTLSKQAEANSDSFQKLGISQEEVKNLSQEDLFEKTIKGLASMEAGTERTTLATELLGRAGADLGPLLNEGSDAIEEQMEIAEKYGMVMSDKTVKASADFKDSLTTLSMTFQGLKNRMMGEFLPSLTSVTDGLAKLFTGDKSGLEDIENGISGIGSKLKEILPTMLEIGVSILESLAKSIIEALPDLVPVAVDVILSLVDFLVDNVDLLMQAAIQIVLALGTGLIEHAPDLVVAALKLIGSAVKAILSFDWKSVGTNMIKGIAKGVTNAKKMLVEAVKKVGGWALEGIKKLLGIASPSKVFRDQVGKNMALGLAEGFEDNMPDLGASLAFDYNIPEYETSYKVDMPENTVDANTRLYSMLNEFFPVLLDAIAEQKEISIDGRKVINYVDSELGKKYAQKARGN